MTLWPLLAQVHRTVSPTEMLTVIRVERKPSTRPHRHIDNLAVSRWHAAHGRPAVLIENSDRWRGVFVFADICSLLAGFSSH